MLVEVLGLDTARQMVEVSNQPSAISDQPSAANDQPSADSDQLSQGEVPLSVVVSGYVGVPALHRGQRDQITFFVNRRWVQDRSLAAAVIQAYHTFLPIGRFPVTVIDVSVDPA